MKTLKRRKTTTIRDVARAAHLSPTAVSRYLNRTMILPAQSATRIEEAIRKLDYQPNGLARNLSLGSSRTIGLVIPEISNPFFASLATAVEEVAFQAGYGVLLCNTHNSPDRELSYLRLLSTRQIDGIVYLTSHADNPDLLAMMARDERIVLVDEDVAGVPAPRVFCENRVGGHIATKHLLEHGHERIAFIGGPKKLLSSRERHAGFENALRECKMKSRSRFVRFGSYTAAFGKEVAMEMLTRSERPTAFFAASDYVALGVLNAAKSLGISVPNDLSLVGFDDMPFAELLSPPLTTVRQPIQALGEAGARLLIQLIKGEIDQLPLLQLPVELISRSSVLDVPKGVRSRIKSSLKTSPTLNSALPALNQVSDYRSEL
jgi:LacI family transcriptional regulator, galactose operon repressor